MGFQEIHADHSVFDKYVENGTIAINQPTHIAVFRRLYGPLLTE